jgi:hypothetical protein
VNNRLRNVSCIRDKQKRRKMRRSFGRTETDGLACLLVDPHEGVTGRRGGEEMRRRTEE